MARVRAREILEKKLKEKGFKEEWDKQAPFWNIQKQLIKARIDSNLTQDEVAKRMDIQRSAVARLETSSKNCNISTLIAYAKVVGIKNINLY